MLFVKSAKIDITPAIPVALAGFISRRDVQFERINDPLEINLLQVKTVGSDPITLVSFDTLSIGSRIDRLVRKLFGDSSVTFASHTHFAPSLDAELPNLGAIDRGYVALVETRLHDLKQILDEVPETAATVKIYTTNAPFSINRRKKAMGLNGRSGIRNLPNPDGPKNDTATVVAFCERASKKEICLFWSYACHPVSFYDQGAVSSDFCGVVRQFFRSLYGAELPCVFAQGFAGDVRPPSFSLGRPTLKTALRFVTKRMLQGPCFGVFSQQEWSNWSSSLATAILSGSWKQLSDVREISYSRRSIALSELHEGGSAEFACRSGLQFITVNFGSVLTVYVLSGEPVTEIAKLIPVTTSLQILAGYTGHMFGYLPTSEMLVEGGYEADGFRHAFRLDGRYRSDISEFLRNFFAASQEPDCGSL